LSLISHITVDRAVLSLISKIASRAGTSVSIHDICAIGILFARICLVALINVLAQTLQAIVLVEFETRAVVRPDSIVAVMITGIEFFRTLVDICAVLAIVSEGFITTRLA
jgi:hypothetical protein